MWITLEEQIKTLLLNKNIVNLQFFIIFYTWIFDNFIAFVGFLCFLFSCSDSFVFYDSLTFRIKFYDHLKVNEQENLWTDEWTKEAKKGRILKRMKKENQINKSQQKYRIEIICFFFVFFFTKSITFFVSFVVWVTGSFCSLCHYFYFYW